MHGYSTGAIRASVLCRAHGVPLGEAIEDATRAVSDEAVHFGDLDVALRFCELTFLKVIIHEMCPCFNPALCTLQDAYSVSCGSAPFV